MTRRPTRPSAAILAPILVTLLALARLAPASPPSRAAAAMFEDVSIAAGVKPETLPPGTIQHPRAMVADVNDDGWDDLLAHNMFPNVSAGKERFEHLVYLNDGDGTFSEAGEAAGLGDAQVAFLAFGDLDNDGDSDAFGGLDIPSHPEEGVGHLVLLNDGRGRYTVLPDSGASVPVGEFEPGRPFYAAANGVLADFNADAKLDLYLGNGQTSFLAPDQLLMGEGDGHFFDASEGLAGNAARPTDGATACDVDGDGDQDVLAVTYGVSNGGAQDWLWINDGKGSFTDAAVERGVASLPGGNYYRRDLDNGRMPEPGKGPGRYIGGNGFGVDCGDVDGDGDMDLLVANISHPTEFPASDTRIPPEQREPLNYTRRWSDPSTLFINGGAAAAWAFQNVWLDVGLPYNEGDIDASMADVDLDGRLDIAMSRDRKYDASYSAWDQQGWFGLYLQQADGRFKSAGRDSGVNHATDPAGAQRMRGSGNINWTDYDHDGDLDLWLGSGPGTAGGHLFKNLVVEQRGEGAHWLALRLAGDGVKINRDALGARVTLRQGNTILGVREKKASRGTYNSTDTRVQHFGLGDVSRFYEVEVRWPDGKVSRFGWRDLPVNHYYTIHYDGSVEVERDGAGVFLPRLGG